jgi:hypothetical protein
LDQAESAEIRIIVWNLNGHTQLVEQVTSIQ